MNDGGLKGKGLVNLSSRIFSSDAGDNDCHNEDLSVEEKDDSTRLTVPFALPKLTKSSENTQDRDQRPNEYLSVVQIIDKLIKEEEEEEEKVGVKRLISQD